MDSKEKQDSKKKSKIENTISVKIKLTKKINPTQDDFINWQPLPGKNEIFIPRNISISSKNSKSDFKKKVAIFLKKNYKNLLNLSTDTFENEPFINNYVIYYARQLFTNQIMVEKLIKDYSPWNLNQNKKESLNIRPVAMASFIIENYFLVKGENIPIKIGSQKFFITAINEFIPKNDIDSKENNLTNALHCFTRLNCCGDIKIEENLEFENYLCKGASIEDLCGIQINKNESIHSQLENFKKAQDVIKNINVLKSQIEDAYNINNQEEFNIKTRELIEKEKLLNKFEPGKLAEFPKIFFTNYENDINDLEKKISDSDSGKGAKLSSKELKEVQESINNLKLIFKNDKDNLDKIILKIINDSFKRENSNYKGCRFKFKDSPANILKQAVTQKWFDMQKELKDISGFKDVQVSDKLKSKKFEEYQKWKNEKGLKYWCYIISYIEQLKKRETSLECEFTLALQLDYNLDISQDNLLDEKDKKELNDLNKKLENSESGKGKKLSDEEIKKTKEKIDELKKKSSITSLSDGCKNGKIKKELQKSCNYLCLEANRPNASLSSQSKCIFCKVIVNCGFHNDKDLQIRDSSGNIIGNIPEKSISSEFDNPNSSNQCGHELKVDESNPKKFIVYKPDHNDNPYCKKDNLKQLNRKEIINLAKNKVNANSYKDKTGGDSNSEDEIAPDVII